MQSVTGEIEAGEARGALSAVGARQRGSVLIFYVWQFAAIGLGALVGYGLAWGVDTFVVHDQIFDPYIMMFVGIALGAIAYRMLGHRLVVQRFRKQMADRSMSTRYNQTINLSDDTIELVSGAVRAVAPWSSVTEIFEAKGYWVFMIGMNAWFAPKRFFTDRAEEKVFIQTAVAHLGEGPRERSKAAVAFATN